MRRAPKMMLNNGGPNQPVSGMAVWLDAQDPNGLVLNGGGNITQWTDKSGNGRHGVPTGSPLNRYTAGGRIWAGGFSTSDYFDCGGVSISTLTGYALFAVIFQLTNAGTSYQAFCGMSGGAATSGLGFGLCGPGTSFSTTKGTHFTRNLGGGLANISPTGTVPLNVANLVAGTFASNVIGAQQNREAANTASDSLGTLSTPGHFTVGAYQDQIATTQAYTTGYVGEAILYASALTAAQILLNMQYLLVIQLSGWSYVHCVRHYFLPHLHTVGSYVSVMSRYSLTDTGKSYDGAILNHDPCSLRTL